MQSVSKVLTVMIVLGIDPGLAFTGYGLVNAAANKFCHIEHGTIATKKTDSQPVRLEQIYDGTCRIIEQYKPDIAGIETLYFVKNITSGLAVAKSLGVIMLALQQHHIPIREIAPNTVKKTVTGVAKAEKIQVQHCVKIILGLPDIPKPDHAADALAIAISAVNTGEPSLP